MDQYFGLDVDSLPPAILDLPAGTPPPGVEQDVEHPHSDAAPLVILPAVLLVLMWICVIGRLWSRKKLSGHFALEDATCVLSAMLTTTYYGLSVASIYVQRVGTHIWDVQLRVFVAAAGIKIDFITIILNPIVLLVIKITFFLLYLRLFRPIRGLRIACYLGITVSALGHLGFFIANMVLGIPQNGGSWQNEIVSKNEEKILKLAVPRPIFDLILDVFILILPIVGIWNLQLSVKKKIGIALVFLTGLGAVISAALCMTYRIKLNNDPKFDVPWDLMPIFLTTDVEMMVEVMITCMPSCAGLARTWLPSFSTIRSKLSYRLGRGSTSDREKPSVLQSDKTDTVLLERPLPFTSPSVDSHVIATNAQPQLANPASISVTTDVCQVSEPRANRNNIGQSMKSINPFTMKSLISNSDRDDGDRDRSEYNV